MNMLSCLVIISCFMLLGSSRLYLSIRILALQGMLLGALPFFGSGEPLSAMVWGIGLSGFLIKGVVLPWLLYYAVRQLAIGREIDPFVGFSTSILIGVIMLALSAWTTHFLLDAGGDCNPVALAAGLFTVLTGLFLVVSRRKAILQALGYLVMENGIYAVGIAIGSELHAMVELGVLLDVSVGVFLMGIMLFRISEEFDHSDADQLRELRDARLPRIDREGENR